MYLNDYWRLRQVVIYLIYVNLFESAPSKWTKIRSIDAWLKYMTNCGSNQDALSYGVKPILRSDEEELVSRHREEQNFSETFIENALYLHWIRVL